MSDASTLTIALTGNPNAGKTTLFNALTGSRLHVGNYAGVTVEATKGRARYGGAELTVVDLPGAYSLTAYSIEEIVTRNFLIEEDPDVVIDVIDASNLERNLYMATQLLELGVPLVLAFNMVDVAESRGFSINTEKLSELLGAPIVTTVGHKGRGLDELLAKAVEVGRDREAFRRRQRRPRYGAEVAPHVEAMNELLVECCGADRHNRWFALKLLENDSETLKRMERLHGEQIDEIRAAAAGHRSHLESVGGDSVEILLADRRYGFISGACTEAVRQTVEARHARSDRIDALLTHPLAGLPIFAGLMYAMFFLVFKLGETPMGWLEKGFAMLATLLNGLWPAGDQSLLRSLLVDGVLGGVGGVLVFVPNIVLLFAAIALLEDTGYMARAAFIMDRLMHKIGLHGKSFIPMLTGFGCSVPAILATRTLESRRDRMVTMLIVPLMSCGARLTIYSLMIPVFFPPAWRAPVLWSIYVIGVAVAVIAAKLLRGTLFKGESAPFVMELPPYRVPTLKGLALHAWEPTRLYVRKAGTVILAVSILMWAVATFPRKTHFDRDYAAAAADAECAYFEALGRLNGPLGLPADSDALTAAMRIERDWRADQALYHAHPAALAEKVAARDKAMDDLRTGPDGERVGAFLAARDEVLRLRRAPAEPAGRGSALAAGGPAIGGAGELIGAATTYLDEIQAPLDDAFEHLANLRRQELLSYTVSGRLGRLIAPTLEPLGFDWKIGTALIGALGAKELFVAQMGIVYAVGEGESNSESLRRKLAQDYSPLTGYCIMLFCLLTAPCMATIAMTAKESGSWKWGAFQLLGMTAVAYLVTGVVYQAGRLVLAVI